MVFDLNKCLGCQTCTIACKRLWTRDEGMEYMWWATVNTQPGRGTPRDWEQSGGGFRDGVAQAGRLPTREDFGDAWKFNHEEVFYGGKGSGAHLKPEGKPDWGPNWDEDQGAGEFPNSLLLLPAAHLQPLYAPGLRRGLPFRWRSYKRPEDGIVLRRRGSSAEGYAQVHAGVSVQEDLLQSRAQGRAEVHLLLPRVDQQVAPACARMCPGRVRFAGYLDDPEGPIYKLVKQWKVAIPLHPEYGTQPNVYYVPPLAPPRFDENGEIDESRPRIPDEYLESLFGPVVHDALATLKAEMEKTSAGGKSELMDLLISRKWIDMFKGFQRDPSSIEWSEPS